MGGEQHLRDQMFRLLLVEQHHVGPERRQPHKQIGPGAEGADQLDVVLGLDEKAEGGAEVVLALDNGDAHRRRSCESRG